MKTNNYFRIASFLITKPYISYNRNDQVLLVKIASQSFCEKINLVFVWVRTRLCIENKQ